MKVVGPVVWRFLRQCPGRSCPKTFTTEDTGEHREVQTTFFRGLAHPVSTDLESSVHLIFIEEPDRDSALYPA